MPDQPCIVAIGGRAPDDAVNSPLYDYLISLAERENPRICYVPTAGADDDAAIVRFYSAFAGRDCRPTHLALIKSPPRDIEAFTLEQDIIFVGGGSTAAMLGVWRALGFDAVLARAWREGKVLCGWSAGGICWFEGGPTDSWGPWELRPLANALCFLPGSFCPHYDGEPLRRPSFQRMVQEGLLPNGYAADDCTALHFKGTTLVEAVAARAGAKAWRVERGPDGVRETELPVRLLGDAGSRPTSDHAARLAVLGAHVSLNEVQITLTKLSKLIPDRQPEGQP